MKQRTSWIMERELLVAQVAPNFYEELKVAWKEEAEELQESIKKWRKNKGFLYLPAPETLKLVENMPVQSSLIDVPFRDETKGDTTSTVASSGCAIVVTKFLERYFDCDKNLKIAHIAEMAVEYGYRGYKLAEGVWKKMGMAHIWFDKFVPRYFGLKSQRISDITQLTAALDADKLPVLLVKNSVYKQDPENTDSHFVCVLGVDSNSYLIYDPEIPETTRCEFERIHKAIRLGWIFSK